MNLQVATHVPGGQVPVGGLHGEGADAQDLADYLPGWSETELREGFWPGLEAIGGSGEFVLEQNLGLDCGETVLRVHGLPLLLSDDAWNVQVLAAPELLGPLAGAMRARRAS